MLKGISPIISPELLKALAEMGHGDELVIADGNFPCHSVGKNSIVIRADGHGVPEILDAILELEKAALIVDSEGDGFKTRYIYDVLSETSKKLYAQQDYEILKEKLAKDPIRSYEPTFVNGKIVASEELDRAILKNMRTCHACEGYNID